jgi:hypothetical protein
MKVKHKVYRSRSFSDIPKNYTGIVYFESFSYTTKSYYKDGKRHRRNGPAVIYQNINFVGVEEYWLNGKKYSEDKWRQQLKKKKKVSLTELKTMQPKKEESKASIWKVQFVINEYDEFKDSIVSTVMITSFKNQLETKIRPLYESFIEADKKFSITVYQDDKKQFTAKTQGSVFIIDGTKTPFSTWLREISK